MFISHSSGVSFWDLRQLWCFSYDHDDATAVPRPAQGHHSYSSRSRNTCCHSSYSCWHLPSLQPTTTQESQHPSYCLYCCQTANLIATAVLADIAILADKAISTKKDYDCYPHHQHAIPILLYPSSSCQYQTLDLRFHITPQYSPYSLISHFHLSSFIYSSPSWRMGAEKFLILMRMGAGEAPWWSLRMLTEHSFPLLPYSSCHGYGYSLLKP